MIDYNLISHISFYVRRLNELFSRITKLIFGITVPFIFLTLMCSSSSAQGVLFDFDNVPVHSSLPSSLTAGGITAHFSATGQGYSIQAANTMGFTPQGFAGNCIYPNSIYLTDLLIRFDQKLSGFSIMYSVQELGCDNSATMRVTAYLNGNLVGTNTKVAANPGTWPVDTLSCSFPQGFDSVVVHYDSRPPTCQDYGVIFMADNMNVIPVSVNAVSDNGFPKRFLLNQNYPNPFNPTTDIGFQIADFGLVTLKVYDVLGREVAELANETKQSGAYHYTFSTINYTLSSGIYFYQLRANGFNQTKKMIVIK
jgi:hypothetical protein